MKKIVLDRDKLYDLYVNKGMSQSECGKVFGCCYAVVGKNLIDHGIPIKPVGYFSQTQLIVNMTDEMYEILYGALLGDGSLRCLKTNADFYYCSKSYQHVEYVCRLFIKSIGNGCISYRERHDKRTQKTYPIYSYRSPASKTFTEEYHRWYKEGIKHIPQDLVLTPLICKIWYIGDGSFIKQKNKSQRLMLYTNGFLKDEIEHILLPQLSAFEPRLQKMDNKKIDGTGFAIRIGKKENIVKFLNYIGQCPFEDYSYKWNILKEQENNEENSNS